jgi:hypothetical protein
MRHHMLTAAFPRAARVVLTVLIALFFGAVGITAAAGVASAITTPTAINDEYTVDHNTVLDVPVATGILSNDTGLPDPTYYRVLTDAAHNFDNSFHFDGSFSYTPDIGFVGDDSYTYCISTAEYGGTCLSNEATILIHVTGPPPPPVAMDDTFYLHPGETAQANGILLNDTNVPVGASYTLLTTGTHAQSAIFNPSGSFTYTAGPDYLGDDAYTYCVTAVYNVGACLSNTGTILIHIQALPPVPVVSDDNYSTPPGVTLTVAAPGYLANDQNLPELASIIFLTSFAHSSDVDVNEDGSINYVPAAGFSGTDTATYCIEADGGDCWSNTATITISVVVPAIVTTPATVTSPAATPAPTTATATNALAATGSDDLPLAGIGILLAIAGGMMLAIARLGRRRHI